MSQRKLTTQPCSPDLVSVRKLLRNRDGHAVTWIDRPIRIFWAYDDGGGNDPDLIIHQTEPGSVGFNIYNRSSQAGILNLPGSTTLYACEEAADWMDYAHYRLWVLLDDESRSRGMTFWIFGQKIHVTASFSDYVTTSDNYIGECERKSDGHVIVNGVDRGKWF